MSTGELIGYARVSKKEQKLDRQINALKAAGCTKIFQEKISTRIKERPQLNECFKYLRAGDILVVDDWDRLGRTLIEKILMIDEIHKMKVKLISLAQNIDTTTPEGRMFFYTNAMFAEYVRSQISLSTKKGLMAARAQGRFGGRKFSLNKDQVKDLLRLCKEGVIPQRDLARMFNISLPTLTRYVRINREIE